MGCGIGGETGGTDVVAGGGITDSSGLMSLMRSPKKIGTDGDGEGIDGAGGVDGIGGIEGVGGA